MQRPIPKTTLLRFPILFGTFLIASGVAFVYRKGFLGDLETQGNNLCKNDPEGTKLIEDLKNEHRKLMYK